MALKSSIQHLQDSTRPVSLCFGSTGFCTHFEVSSWPTTVKPNSTEPGALLGEPTKNQGLAGDVREDQSISRLCGSHVPRKGVQKNEGRSRRTRDGLSTAVVCVVDDFRELTASKMLCGFCSEWQDTVRGTRSAPSSVALQEKRISQVPGWARCEETSCV